MNQKISQALDEMLIQDGSRLRDIADEQPVLVAFLRHLGCVFCMEAMKDIQAQRAKIESKNVKICLVHMATPEVAEGYFAEYGLDDVCHVSDPDCKYYESFGLIKGKFNQLFGLQVWLRTAQVAVKDISALRRKQIGDGFQMPGVFMIHQGKVINSYVHERASDRPDYLEMTNCSACN